MRVKQLIVSICIITFLLFILFEKESQEMIKYFPFDESMSFIEAETNLSLVEQTGNDQYKVKWKVDSNLQQPIYLRQDVSLLFMDGQLKGIKSLWKEEESKISLNEDIDESDSSHFEAISYHHGEIHYPNDEIKSIQQMTYDELYVIDSPYSPLESFHKAESDFQLEWAKTLTHTTDQALHYRWKQWMEKLDIASNDYILHPLVNIYEFSSKPLNGFSQAETNKIIAQLWEGLYKEYIIPLSNTSTASPLYMPIILISKNYDHLFVLFNDATNQVQALKQIIP